jgi:hypothetical protein
LPRTRANPGRSRSARWRSPEFRRRHKSHPCSVQRFESTASTMPNTSSSACHAKASVHQPKCHHANDAVSGHTESNGVDSRLDAHSFSYMAGLRRQRGAAPPPPTAHTDCLTPCLAQRPHGRNQPFNRSRLSRELTPRAIRKRLRVVHHNFQILRFRRASGRVQMRRKLPPSSPNSSAPSPPPPGGGVEICSGARRTGDCAATRCP